MDPTVIDILDDNQFSDFDREGGGGGEIMPFRFNNN